VISARLIDKSAIDWIGTPVCSWCGHEW